MNARGSSGQLFNPYIRFWTGVSLIPGFLLIDSLPFQGAVLLLLAAAAMLAGKRIRLRFFLILTGSILFFHLLNPTGRILLTIGDFRITAGAILRGLSRSAVLIGLILISFFSVSSSLRFPGRLGSLLALTFYYFERLMQARGKISRKGLISSLDDALLKALPPEELDSPAEVGTERVPGRLSQYPAALALIGVVWTAAILTMLT